MNIIRTNYRLTIKFSQPILGSQPGRDDPASDYIRQKTSKENPELQIPLDEVESLPAEIEKGTTCFYRDNNGLPCFRSYQVLGNLKDAASQLNGLGGNKNLRSKIEASIFVTPVVLSLLGLPADFDINKMEIEERPLRAQTLQGPRVCLSRSEKLPAGVSITCNICVVELPKFVCTEEMLQLLLSYASQRGLGQWRSSGTYGAYEFELTKL